MRDVDAVNENTCELKTRDNLEQKKLIRHYIDIQDIVVNIKTL